MKAFAPFEVIITTYNRAESVNRLVQDVLSCEPRPQRVIVVDTSAEQNLLLKGLEGVSYIRSNLSHQNQPYKRLVGALTASQELLIFLDDDLELLDNGIFRKILPSFESPDVVGATTGLKMDVHTPGRLSAERPWLIQFLRLLTGVPIPGVGRISWAGHTGRSPESPDRIETLSGPVMAFRRRVFLQCIDNDLLALFEQRLAIPEDKIISLRARRFGCLQYMPDVVLRHLPIPSTYFVDHRDHARRNILSRSVFNREYCSLRSYPPVLGQIHFTYYSFWRLLIAALRWGILRSVEWRERFLGMLDGVRLVTQGSLSAESLCPDVDFRADAAADAHDG